MTTISLLILFSALCPIISSFSVSNHLPRKISQPISSTNLEPIYSSSISRTTKTAIGAVDIKDNSGEVQLRDDDDDDDNDDDWEYEEFENLRENDFYDSEWKVGTLMEGQNKIEETWARLVVKDGEFVCVWGDGASGKWNFDTASQFLSMTKDTIGGWLGKRIWAGTTDDYYYVEGTIRGWSPISPASVIGQWQARRLGVDKDEAGIAPWFQDEEEEEELNIDVVSENPENSSSDEVVSVETKNNSN
mmetsp:Transcript_22516/g.25634  ORF Transcript_22516/g.25634 Transcript_22516/m.25634 type:complete len:247 (+) Transcript_22516:169-909(+)